MSPPFQLCGHFPKHVPDATHTEIQTAVDVNDLSSQNRTHSTTTIRVAFDVNRIHKREAASQLQVQIFTFDVLEYRMDASAVTAPKSSPP